MNAILRCGLNTLLIMLAISDPPRLAAEGPKRPLVHPLFCDHVVLQRDLRVPVWGWTEPGATVTVKFADQTRTAVAGADGKWLVKLKALPAATTPRVLTITSSAGPATIRINDVLVGDVWLCSGQSNMEIGIKYCNASNDIATANFPNLRLLTIALAVGLEPQSTLECRWLPCLPETVQQGLWDGFSGVAFFFGRELHQELGVPVGLIQSAWGGTLAEAWTSTEALAPMGDFTEPLATVRTQAQAVKNQDYSQVYDQWFFDA